MIFIVNQRIAREIHLLDKGPEQVLYILYLYSLNPLVFFLRQFHTTQRRDAF